MKDISVVESIMATKASEKLQKEIEEELKKEDPSKEKAVAALNRNIKNEDT